MSYLNKQRSIAYITSIILTVYGYTLDDLIRNVCDAIGSDWDEVSKETVRSEVL